MNMTDTIKLFKSLKQEPNKYAYNDAKSDLINHKRLGKYILHIIPYKSVPIKQVIFNLKHILNNVTDKPSNIDRNMNAVVMGNLDNAIDTIGLNNVKDNDIRAKISQYSNKLIDEYGIDSGFGDSKDKNSWRN